MNPWALPENTGDADTDLAAALRARYGNSNQAIFGGYGQEVGLGGPGVPKIKYSESMAPPEQDLGRTDYYQNSARILVDPKLSPDMQQSTLAHEITHAADAYSAPYPLRGPSHHYFYGDLEPELNSQLREHMAQEQKSQSSIKLKNPWSLK